MLLTFFVLPSLSIAGDPTITEYFSNSSYIFKYGSNIFYIRTDVDGAGSGAPMYVRVTNLSSESKTLYVKSTGNTSGWHLYGQFNPFYPEESLRQTLSPGDTKNFTLLFTDVPDSESTHAFGVELWEDIANWTDTKWYTGSLIVRGDQYAPSSQVVTPSEGTHVSGPFSVTLTGGDQGSYQSGIKNYYAQYSKDGGSWVDWYIGSSSNAGTFSPGGASGIYYFRSKAVDNVTRDEDYPSGYDTYVYYDPAVTVTFRAITVDTGVVDPMSSSNRPQVTYVKPDGTTWYAYPYDGYDVTVSVKPSSSYSYSQLSSSGNNSHRWYCNTSLSGTAPSSGSQTVTKYYYEQWKPPVTLSGTDSGHTVSTEAHKQFGADHLESSFYGSWCDWSDSGSTLTFSATTTGSPPKSTSDTRSWIVDTVVSATINYVSAPGISRTPSSLSTSCTQGQNASSQSFEVWNSGGGTLSYSISDNATWLSVSPTSGTSTTEHDTITVTYSTSGLSSGSYSATITITASGATNSPQILPVWFTVNSTVGCIPSVVETVPIPGTILPYYDEGLEHDGTHLWASVNRLAPEVRVYEIDPSTGNILRSYPQNYYDPWSSNVIGLAYDRVNDLIYNHVYPSGPIYAVDALTLVEVPGSSISAPASWIHDIAFDSVNQILWAVKDTGTIYKMNPFDGSVLGSFASPGNIGVTWDGNYLWVGGAGYVYQIDPDQALADGNCSNAIQQQIYLQDIGAAGGRLAWDGAFLWTASSAQGLFYRIDVCGAPVSSDMFSDVPSDYWAYNYIIAIYNDGITTGCAQDDPNTPENERQYCPEDYVTRDQMAAFLVRAVEGEPPLDYCTVAPFPDVTPDMWSCRYIKRLYELGITTGYGDGTYGPYDMVPREQMAAFIIRAVEGEPVPTYCDSGTAFPDVTSIMWSCKYIKRLKELGITTGYQNGTYGPYDLVTRAQMAAFLARAFLGM